MYTLCVIVLELNRDYLSNCCLQYVTVTVLQCRGFNIDYLSKVAEVKDTVNKHSLMHHLCTIVCDNFQESSDLYSDFGAIVRCSKVSQAQTHARNIIINNVLGMRDYKPFAQCKFRFIPDSLDLI